MYSPITTPDQLAQILAAGRRRARLTQTEVAARLGISQSRVSALETDASAISLRQLLALLGLYRLQLHVLERGALNGLHMLSEGPPPTSEW